MKCLSYELLAVPGRSTNIGLGFRLQRSGSEEVAQMFRVEDTRLRESRKKCEECDQNPTSSSLD
jgi:hypothetical protein